VRRRRPDTNAEQISYTDHCASSLVVGLAEQRLGVAGEGSPYFKVESIWRGSPQDHLSFIIHRASAHSDRESGQYQIKRTPTGEDKLGTGAMDRKCDLTVTDINKRA
jgi:hypothetical protein